MAVFVPNDDRPTTGERTWQEPLPVGQENAASAADVWPCLDCGKALEAGQRYRCIACAERARLAVSAAAASPLSDRP